MRDNMATTPKQGKVGEPDNAKKADLDKQIVNHYLNLLSVGEESKAVKGRLAEESKTKGSKKLVGLLLYISKLDTKKANINKELKKVLGKRIELFGEEDMLSSAELSEIMEQYSNDEDEEDDKED